MITPNEKQKATIKAKKEAAEIARFQYEAVLDSLTSYTTSILEGSDADLEKKWVINENLDIVEAEEEK